MMTKFLHSNDTLYRLLRTVCQGIIGVLVANLDLLIGRLTIDPALKPMLVALVMAVLSPIMAEIGKHEDTEENSFVITHGDAPAEDQDEDYFITKGDGSK